MVEPYPRYRHNATGAINNVTSTIEQELTTEFMVGAEHVHSRPSIREQPIRGEGETEQPSLCLRIIKLIALFFIALCVCAGAVLSKVSAVSITGRMFNLTTNLARSQDELPRSRSVLFIQLTLILIIPEAISFIRCLAWGVIGKTTKSFPWPCRSALIWVR